MVKEEIYKIIDSFLVEAKDQNGRERSLEQLNRDRHLAAEKFEELIKRKEQISMLEGSITEREHSIGMFQLALDNVQVKAKHNQDECWCCSEIKAIKRAAEEDLEYLRKNYLKINSRLKWKTKDGDLLEIGQMTTAHILNAKKMLEKQVSEVSNALADCDEYESSITYSNGIAFLEKAYKYIRAFNKELRLREDFKENRKTK